MLNLVYPINQDNKEETDLLEKYKSFYSCLEYIKVPSIKELTLNLLNKYSDEDKLKDAVGVTEWVIFLLKFDKLLGEGLNSYFIDIIIASSLIHNLTYSYGEKDWTKIFKTRELIANANEELSIPIQDNYISSLCMPIESQLGKDMPIDKLHPNANTPGYQVALACAIYYKKL